MPEKAVMKLNVYMIYPALFTIKSQRKSKELTALLSSSVNVGMFAVNAGDCLTEQWELKRVSDTRAAG